MKLVFLIFSFIIILEAQLATNCHYSCGNCIYSNSYLHCLSCSNDAIVNQIHTLNINNPLSLLGYKNTGLCVAAVDLDVNILGIILLILLTAVLVITRTKQAFYLFYTFQTFALFSFVEIAWLNPLNYMLQSLQYFQFFNLALYSWKQNDNHFTQNNYYRLGEFFGSTSFLKSIAINGPLYLIIFIILVTIQIFMLVRNQYFRLQDEEIRSKEIESQDLERQKNRDLYPRYCLNFLTDERLNKIRNFFHIIFFLLMQEFILSIYMASRFNFPDQPADIIIISILFGIMLLYFSVCVYYLPISLFANRTSQFTNIWKKIIYPLFILGPIQNHFVLFIFIIVFTIGESCFEGKYNPQMKGCNRWQAYRVYEIILVLFLLLIYYIIQTVANSQSASDGYRVILALFLAIAMISPLIQLPFGIYEAFFQKNPNQELPIESMGTHQRYKKDWKQKNQTKNVLQITEDSMMDYDAPQAFRKNTPGNLQNLQAQIAEVNEEFQRGSYERKDIKTEDEINSKTSQSQQIKVSSNTNKNRQSEQSKQKSKEENSIQNLQTSQKPVFNTYADSYQRKLQQQNQNSIDRQKQQQKKENKDQQQKNNNGVQELQQQPKKKKKRLIDNIDKQLRLRYGIK